MIFFSLLFPCYLRSGRSAGVSFWGSTGVGGDRLKAYSYSMMTFWFVGYIVVCIINLPQHIYVLYELFCFTNIFWVNNWSPPEGQGDYTLISSSAYRISSSTVISAGDICCQPRMIRQLKTLMWKIKYLCFCYFLCAFFCPHCIVSSFSLTLYLHPIE